jgi:hypothetical protein
VYANEPSSSSSSDPCSGCVPGSALRTSPSASVSFASTPGTSGTSVPSSSSENASSAATGACCAARTVIVAVAGAESAFPSFARYVNVSVPTKPSSGLYVRVAPVPVSVPCAGGVTTAKVTRSPSASVAFIRTSTAVPSSVAAATASATGGVLAGVPPPCQQSTDSPRS